MKPLIIYHDKCTDGFGAAFAAWMKFDNDAEYVPASYGQALGAGNSAAGPVFVSGSDAHYLAGREVYVLDFSFDRETTQFIVDNAKKFVWLDHHKTAFEMWTGGSTARHEEIHDAGHYILLDNDKSGALLAWEHFHPNTHKPQLIARIDDRDRWVFKYADSKAFHAGLAAMQPWSFDQWQHLLRVDHYVDVVDRGAAILQAQDANVARMAQQAVPCILPGPEDRHHKVKMLSGLAVNASLHQSELGHVVATKSGTYALIWYYAPDGRVNCSLRSNGDYDVSAVAKTFGGGGHKNAAGFQTDLQTLMGWLK